MNSLSRSQGIFFNPTKGHTSVRVFAPERNVKIFVGDVPDGIVMEPDDDGYRSKKINVDPGVLLGLRVEGDFPHLPDDGLLPHPASSFLPNGILGGSEIIDPSFKWSDFEWNGIDKKDLLIYELHVGTFTRDGTYKAAMEKIPHLKSLGITCVELMPLNEMPGKFGWGYDPLSIYAPFHPYGRPEELKEFINELHKNGIAVCLDQVINHIGPGGENYLRPFGPYVSEKGGKWGSTFNLDGKESSEIRKFLLENFYYWMDEYHIDAFRLDAAQCIFDTSKKHFLRELREGVTAHANRTGKKVLLISEIDNNDKSFLKRKGFNQDAIWAFDFHGALLSVIDPDDKTGWQRDMHGLEDLAKAVREPALFTGSRISAFAPKVDRPAEFGNFLSHFDGSRFVVWGAGTHDTSGNRPDGKRISSLVSFQKLKSMAALSLLSRYNPQIFMGDEFGAKSEFHFFANLTDGLFIDGVNSGRKEMYALFDYDKAAIENSLAPVSRDTFEGSKLDFEELEKEENKFLFNWHKDLITLRKTLTPHIFKRDNLKVQFSRRHNWIKLNYNINGRKITIIHSLSEEEKEVNIDGNLKVLMHSEDRKYGGHEDIPETYNKRVRLKGFSSVVLAV